MQNGSCCYDRNDNPLIRSLATITQILYLLKYNFSQKDSHLFILATCLFMFIYLQHAKLF